MRRYYEWAFIVAIAIFGVSGVNAQQATSAEEPEIVANPDELVDKSDETDVERLSDTGLVNEEMIARLREMTLTDLIAEARRLIDAENIREAAPYVAVARERDPDNIEITVLLGELALLNGEIQPAREKLLEAYRVNRNNYHAAVALGRLYLITRRYRQAVNYLEKAEEIAPPDQHARAQRLLAEAYLGSGMLIKARDMAQRAADAAPQEYDPHRVYATVLIATLDTNPMLNEIVKNQALDQIAALETIASDQVAANPGDLPSLKRLIQAWTVHQQALRVWLNKLVVVGPDSVPTDEILPGKREDAAKITDQMVKLLIKQAEADRMVQLFQIIQVSEQTLSYVPDSSPDASKYWSDHGLLLLSTNQYEPAYKAFEKAVELDPDNSEAREYLNQLKASSGVPTDEPTNVPQSAAPESSAAPAISASAALQD